MKHLINKLQKKGWTKEEIDKVFVILKRAELRKSRTMRFFEHFAYWMILAIILIGNAVIALSLAPLILVFDAFNVYIIIIITGLVFGVLFDNLLSDIPLTKHHHALNTILIPVIAVVIFMLMTSITNYVGLILELDVVIHNPLVIGLIYTVSIITPHTIKRVVA